MKLSLAIITFNEECNLGRTLSAAAGLADEIIIMDSGSTDQTVAIAEFYGAQVITQAWLGYAAQKNRLFEACRGAWILSLDADEVLTPVLKQSIAAAVAAEYSDIVGYICKRHTVYMGRELKYAFSDHKLRLVRREQKPRWEGEIVHEKLVIEGNTSVLAGRLLHYSYRDFTDHFERSIRYARLGAAQKSGQGGSFSLPKLILRPPLAFFKSYILKRGFLDGRAGLIVSMMRALDVWMKYLFLFEKM